MMKSILFSFFLIFVFFDVFSQELIATDEKALMKFIILDPKGIPEEGAVVTVDAVDKKFSQKGVSDIDGKCEILIPEGVPYKLIVHKFDLDFDFGVKTIALKPGSQISTYTLTIELVTTFKRVYTLDHLHFEPNQFETSTLKAESLSALNKLVDSLKASPKMKIEIGGHTDNTGDDIANLHLSQKRADAIRNYLVNKGIKGERILAKGYGEKAPVSSNDSPEGRSLNRRTEVKVLEE